MQRSRCLNGNDPKLHFREHDARGAVNAIAYSLSSRAGAFAPARHNLLVRFYYALSHLCGNRPTVINNMGRQLLGMMISFQERFSGPVSVVVSSSFTHSGC